MKIDVVFFRPSILLTSITFLTAILFLLACGQKKQHFGSPINLRCEYQVNPLGIDVKIPRLSWQVNDTRRGALQTAYQILVASSESGLEQDQGDVWDSGKMHSDESVHVPFQGSGLGSKKRYFWKVRTWDAMDQPSPYSDIAFWEMALLQPKDWQASWIGKVEIRPEKEKWEWKSWIWHPKEHGVNVPVYLRHTFNLPANKPIERAVIRTTADNKFKLLLNGKMVGSGDNLNEVFEFDAKPLLLTGLNVFAVEAANTAGDICGFVLSMKIEYSDGGVQFFCSDASWKTALSAPVDWNTIEFNDNSWIAARAMENWSGSTWGRVDEPYTPPRSVMLRTEFKLQKPVRRARAYVTGLGSYVMYLNGERLGNDIFTPGWTDYPTRLQYQTYSATALVKKGDNAIGVLLGNMWWSSGLGWKRNEVYSEGPLKSLVQLSVEYDDGTTEEIVSDGTWKAHESPIVENTLYDGEKVDARLEEPNWHKPQFDDRNWEAVSVLDAEKAMLVAQQGPTIQITEELHPIARTEPQPGIYIFDMGQNMVGWARLKVRGESGTKVQLRFAETLQENGLLYTENLRGAKATDTYILKGDGTEVWEPHFTYHGFRYVEVTGYPGIPAKDAITGCVIHSNPEVTGSFECSSDLLNQFQHNICWGLRGNLHSVPTDCPQRDERLGWMGDAQIFAPTACFNRNMARFFTKWMHDIADCQDADGAVHDVNPAIVVSGPAKPAWGDAVVVIPWVVYQHYGDTRIIAENYPAMAAWVDYMKAHSKNYLYERDGYGDWVAVVPSPKLPLSAAYYYYDTVLMSKMASVIGKSEDAARYAEMAEKIARAFNAKYLNAATNSYEGDTQTANLLPLAFGITPEELTAKVIENVAQDVIKRGKHLSTGFIGTAYLLPLLSQLGTHDLAYDVAAQETYPSWCYMVKKGATTVWELWNSDTEGPGMNSRNHFALGSVGEWYYQWLGGIRIDPYKPGFKQVIIAPRPVGDLTYAKAALETMYGKVECDWKITGKRLILCVNLPANTTAQIHVPIPDKTQPQITESGAVIYEKKSPAAKVNQLKYIKSDAHAVMFQAGAGRYEFLVEW
ncbi:family 78 glycoside hydrolase catalytic domain [candidate division KSB1 bacterium]|nr:family 78 glycoside hydrolase catalytic domain [candidate division KSB1 bacterium]